MLTRRRAARLFGVLACALFPAAGQPTLPPIWPPRGWTARVKTPERPGAAVRAAGSPRFVG